MWTREETAGIFYCRNIVDVSKESMIIALTGSLSKMNAFIELLEDFNITEVARTGITGLARGSADLNKM